MKFSVLINNYNYARFLPETLASVAAQTLPAYEIILVDDGSTDDSLAKAETLRGRIPSLRVHSQLNQGQLAAFQSAVGLATGDWCAFLDSDDVWRPDHLEAAANVLQNRNDICAYYCDHVERPAGRVCHAKWPAGPVGPLSHLVSATGCRVGTITSTLILERGLATDVTDLPPEFRADWRTRADDCLVFGAALAGARFWRNARATVEYRIHGENLYARRERTPEENAAYDQRRERLFAHYRARSGLPAVSSPEELATEARRAESDIHPVLRRRFRRAILRAPAPLWRRLGAWLACGKREKPGTPAP